MKFDFASDVHVDKNDHPVLWDYEKQNDVLVISGDISNSVDRTIDELKRMAKVYETVIFVDGNHEHYSRMFWLPVEERTEEIKSVSENMQRLNSETPDNVIMLGTYQVGSTLFVGANGWYDFKFADPDFAPLHIQGHFKQTAEESRDHWESFNNDRYINFGEHSPESYAKENFDAIRNAIVAAQDDDSVDEIVIITHTVPHREFLIWKMQNEWNLAGGGMGNSMMEEIASFDIKKKIKVWGFGHTHISHDRTIDGIRYICQPRGYYSENYGWRTVTIDTKDQRQSAFE